MVIIPDKPVIHSLNFEWYQSRVHGIDMLRLDTLHPDISGNKWFKLQHNLSYARDKGHEAILTFGGGYSNHLAATAAAANVYSIRSIGVIRGIHAELTPTLQFCVDNGMQLHFVAHDEYKRKDNNDWLVDLAKNFPNTFIIPEGGANEQGRLGAEEIATFIPAQYTHICVSVGTGTTMAGICNGLKEPQTVYGYAPMKGGNYMEQNIVSYLKDGCTTQWQLFDDWHFGGFGKMDDTLITFMNDFYNINHIPLDRVYTAKMMYGLQQQLYAGVFPADAVILCIHTGGLQGNNSIAGKLIY
jgi:1-aminocyclopropane-1-carboxylate deaminase